MIPQRNISLIANALAAAGGRRIPEAVIERDYVLAWFLTGLAGHPLRDVLAFKGGTALRRCWFEGYRFSEDLAFLRTASTSARSSRREMHADRREIMGDRHDLRRDFAERRRDARDLHQDRAERRHDAHELHHDLAQRRQDHGPFQRNAQARTHVARR